MEKSPFIIKSLEIKSYQFETLFSRTFFLAPVWFYTKKVLGKKSSNKWKCMIHKSFFQVFLFLGFILFRTFFPEILFPETLMAWPPYYFRKKVPGIQNTGLYFQWHLFQGLKKIRTFFPKFLFPGFFSRNFFSRDFLT